MPLPPLLTLITDSRFLDHDTGGDHPEIPARLQAILAALEQGCFSCLDFQKTRPAERQWLTAAHDEGWLCRFEEAVLSGKTFIDHVDNQVGYESYEVAALAAAAGLVAIDLLENRQAEQSFCLVRPPGHHAERDRPFGFCFFNNCVVAARYWQQHHGRKRIVVFDFDAHHGNGIQSAFERDADCLYISIHEHPSFSYPGTGYPDEKGVGVGRGSILNLPLAPGAGEKGSVLLGIEDDGQDNLMTRIVTLLEHHDIPFTRLLRVHDEEYGSRIYLRLNTFKIALVLSLLREAGINPAL